MSFRVAVVALLLLTVIAPVCVAQQIGSKPAKPIKVKPINPGEMVEPLPPPLADAGEFVPKPMKNGVLEIPQLGMAVRLNENGVVVVERLLGNRTVPIYVARQGGLEAEVFVPGDSIEGVNGFAVKTPQDLYKLTRTKGWKYVEGIDNGTDVGAAYIGRLYIP